MLWRLESQLETLLPGGQGTRWTLCGLYVLADTAHSTADAAVLSQQTADAAGGRWQLLWGHRCEGSDVVVWVAALDVPS